MRHTGLDQRRRDPRAIVAMVMLLAVLSAACTGSSSDTREGDEPAGISTPTLDQERESALLYDGGFIHVRGPGIVRVKAGSGTHELTYRIVHFGATAEQYEVEAETDLDFVDLSGVPDFVDLEPDETVLVSVPIAVSSDVPPGTKGEIVFRVTLLRRRNSADGATTSITVVTGTN